MPNVHLFSFGEVDFVEAEIKEVVDTFTRVCLLCARIVALRGAGEARACNMLI